MKPDIFIISLGCPRNLVDSEVLIGMLRQKGFKVFTEFTKNRIAIVNTCGFIEDAKSESIDMILELAALKRDGRLEHLIVTGCFSQRYSDRILKEIGEVDGIFGCGSFTEIPEFINRIAAGEKVVNVDKRPKFLYNHTMPRAVLTPRHSVYVKIQEGCMNLCSYCVIPKIRGPYRSRSIDSVLKEVLLLKESGAREINLVGQDTTLYGTERYKAPVLGKLLRKVSRIMKDGWVRLLYTHPAHYDQDIIDAVKNETSICKYLDLPIQHINDKILKSMNRHVTKGEIVELIEKLRRSIPEVAIRTSIIVGFPGEGDKEMDELARFLKEVEFDRLGVFTYSREEGTKSFDLPGQVAEDEKERRLKRIMELQQDISEKLNRRSLGSVVKVLIDDKDKTEANLYLGRTQHDAPSVDGTVYVHSKKRLKQGDFVDAKIIDTLEYDLVGKVTL
ncbi:MAG: 30S ribosomal protein S12 methylthiotransferase RimO [Candidatus Omnitrophota bacterium]